MSSQFSFETADADDICSTTWNGSDIPSILSSRVTSPTTDALPVRASFFPEPSSPAVSTSSSRPCPPSIDLSPASPLFALPSTSSSSGVAYPSHPRYFFQDDMAVFLVEGCLFRVHRYFLDRESDVFPRGASTREEPIELPGVTKAEFENLLDFFYEGMHNDKSLLSLSSWTSLLSISSRFSMTRIRARAISEIITYPVPGLDPVDQVALATKYDIPDWLQPAYTALCQRANALEFEEAEKLGMKTTVLVAKAREAVRKQATCPASCFEKTLVERVVDELFWPTSTPTPSPIQVSVTSPQPQELVAENAGRPQSSPRPHSDKYREPSAAKDASWPNPLNSTAWENTSANEIGDKGNLARGNRDERGKELCDFIAKRDQEMEMEAERVRQQREREQRVSTLTESIYEQVFRAEEEKRERGYWTSNNDDPVAVQLYIAAKKRNKTQKAAKRAIEREKREKELANFMAKREQQHPSSDNLAGLRELAKFMAEQEEELSENRDDK